MEKDKTIEQLRRELAQLKHELALLEGQEVKQEIPTHTWVEDLNGNNLLFPLSDMERGICEKYYKKTGKITVPTMPESAMYLVGTSRMGGGGG